MSNKSRILYLLQFLQQESDEERPVSTAQIRRALREKGCAVTIETLRDDIASLQDAGYDIAVHEQNGLPTTYSYLDRELDVPEVQILLDAVSSSQFISRTRSEQLAKKLCAMAGPSHREALKPGIMLSEFVKTPNSQLLYTVQRLQEAIALCRKITFQYFHYDLNKRRVPRHGGKWYVLSPYVTIWRLERYFVVGYSEERQALTVFRVDRMGLPELLEEGRVPPPERFDPRDYTERVFNMYDDGLMETVTLRCRHHMIDHIIDYFGKDVALENITPVSFDVRVAVSLSTSFYAWVLGFVGDMAIVSPPMVCEAYRRTLERGLESITKGWE